MNLIGLKKDIMFLSFSIWDLKINYLLIFGSKYIKDTWIMQIILDSNMIQYVP